MSASVVLKGGLGNVLFQLAFLYSYAKKYSLEPVVYTCYCKDSKANDTYLTKFWKVIKKEEKPKIQLKKINEDPKKPCVYINYPKYTNVLFEGYFQSAKFFEDYSNDIKKMILDYDFKKLSLKYPDISNHFFIHIRGGDYINHPIHELKGIAEYYKKCLNENEKYVLFTNDIKYANSMGINYPLIEENELNTLFLMSKCKGCIIPNSSFSWWGSWLGRETMEVIYMPSKWFNTNLDHSDIYFSGVKNINV